MTVLEWPKADQSEADGDVTRIYLATSRDGAHFDLQYAHLVYLQHYRVRCWVLLQHCWLLTCC